MRQELEVEVKQWQDRHQALRESYEQQAQELQRLKEQTERLHKHLSAIKDTKPIEESYPCDFDLFAYVDWEDLTCSMEATLV